MYVYRCLEKPSKELLNLYRIKTSCVIPLDEVFELHFRRRLLNPQQCPERRNIRKRCPRLQCNAAQDKTVQSVVIQPGVRERQTTDVVRLVVIQRVPVVVNPSHTYKVCIRTGCISNNQSHSTKKK